MDCRDYSKPVSEPRAVATGSCHALLIKTVIGFLLRYHYDPVATARGSDAMRIWIDLANSPHVPFFRALIPEFVARQHQVEITAREFAQTVELATKAGMTPHVVGGHGGGSITGKARNLIGRAASLRKWARDRGFDLAVSHNSYAQIAAAAALGIRTVTLMDYERQNLPNVIMPREALDGANLIAASDLVISAGGTMNREAAALGVPAASVYAGKWAAIDEELVREGRLQRISSREDINALVVQRKQSINPRQARGVRTEITRLILE